MDIGVVIQPDGGTRMHQVGTLYQSGYGLTDIAIILKQVDIWQQISMLMVAG